MADQAPANVVTPYVPNYKTTARRSPLTANELDALGFRRSYVIRIEIKERNGHRMFENVPIRLILHFWEVLGQKLDNLLRYRSGRIRNDYQFIQYHVEEAVHLPHISESVNFDFYEVPDEALRGEDVKLRTYQCVIINEISE